MSQDGDDFVAYVCDQLGDGDGDVRARSMFGGHGLYREGVIIGIVFEGRVYAKTEEPARFEAAGMGPFRPRPTQTSRRYWEVPPDDVDDRAALRSWFGLGGAPD